MNDYKSRLNAVIRDRITEESVRKRDAHEIVDWIHGLEDEAAGLEHRLRELLAVLGALERMATECDQGQYIDYPNARIIFEDARELLEQDYE